MPSANKSFEKFLKDVMRKRRCLPSHLATELGISHATVSRWLSGKDIPNVSSCRKLAEYSGVSVDKILGFVGHLTGIVERSTAEWPEFREYVKIKYPAELDEDMIVMIEDLIERRRAKRYEKRKSRRGRH
jgi:transcriptional regulator with XRE-family HTH domain